MTSDRPDDFMARVRSISLGSVTVARSRVTHLTATRTLDRLGDVYSDYLQIGFRLHGVAAAEQRRNSFIADPSHVSLLFPGDPFVTRIDEPCEVVQFYVPIRDISAHRLPIRHLSGRRDPLTPTAIITRQLLLSLTSDTPAPPTPQTSGQSHFIGEALTQLGLGLLHELHGRTAPTGDAHEAMRVRATAFIYQHAHHPGLSVADVGAHLGVSRRYLHHVFAGDGPGVGSTIRHARVARARHLLDTQPRLSIAQIAVASGFGGPDQLTRAFRAEHGYTPREYRQGADVVDPSGP